MLGQNTFTAIHLNDGEEIRNKKAKTIDETNTFYSFGNKSIKINNKKFNKNNSILVEERFENDKLIARLTFEYDSINNIETSRIFERWHEKLGYSKETAKYFYDKNNFLVSVIEYSSKGIKFRETKIENDSIGNPVYLIVLDANEKTYGYEKSTYNYIKNERVETFFDANDKIIQSDTIPIYFNYKYPTAIYNELGDCMKTRDSETEYEYKYDNFGNWLTMKIFDVRINKKGKFKRKIRTVFRRKIIYWE